MRAEVYATSAVILLAMFGCSRLASSNEPAGSLGQKAANSFKPYKDPKQRFEIQDVAVIKDYVDAKSTIEKLPAKLRPSDPEHSKTVVIQLLLASEKADLNEMKSSEFPLRYQLGGKEIDVLCVGFSMGGSDMWGLAEKEDHSIFVRAKPPQKQKLLFLVPSAVNEGSLLHNLPGESTATITSGIRF